MEPTAPAPRDRGENMATLMDYSKATSPTPAGGRRPAAAVTNPSPSAMGDIITGVGEMGVDDKLYGLSKKKLDQRYSGQGALAALRGEEAEAGMDDPFKHARARPKLHARDMGVAAPMPAGGIPGTEDAANRAAVAAIEASERKVFESLSNAHQALLAAARAAPRDGSGALIDYRPLLHLLATQHSINLNADAAGTLVATIDVQGGISFEEFMEVIAMGLQHGNPPPGPASTAPPPQMHAEPRRPMPPAAAPVVRGVRADPVSLQQAKHQMQLAKSQAPASAFAEYMPNYPQPKAPQNVQKLLGGVKVSSSAVAGASGLAGNTDLAALLNGGTNHSRRSEMAHTVGKSEQWR